MEPIKVLAVNGESDPAETGSFTEIPQSWKVNPPSMLPPVPA